MKDCTTCKYGFVDEQFGFPMCHHPLRFSKDCVDFNMHEEKEEPKKATGIEEKKLPDGLDEAAEKSAKSWRKNPDGSESREMLFQPHIRGFKAGAEWMAGQFEKNCLDALRKVKVLRTVQNMHAKTLNYGYRCLAIRLGKEVDEILEKLKID